MSDITADPTMLMREVHMAAVDYMQHAVDNIDGCFGKGYAKAHPELICSYMQTVAMSFGAMVIAREITDALEDIGSSIRECDTTSYLDNICDELKSIAKMVACNGF